MCSDIFIFDGMAEDEQNALIDQSLQSIRNSMRNYSMDLSLLEITKKLGQKSKDYKEGGSCPAHVFRANSRGGRKYVKRTWCRISFVQTAVVCRQACGHILKRKWIC